MSAPTATTAGARDHARAQEGTQVVESPTVPASRQTDLPPGVRSDTVVWSDRLPGGGYAQRVLAAGTRVRLTALTADTCAQLVLYRAGREWERLNTADTAKIQWQVYPHEEYLLLSDQARVLATMVEDTSGHHDTIYGASTRSRNARRYGDGSLHGASPAGRELLVNGALKNGLGRGDVPPVVSLFHGVRVDEQGTPQWLGSAGAGAHVTLRTEVDVVLVVATAAHPLDPRETYTAGPLDVLAWRDRTTTPDDTEWGRAPEGRRAFENTVDDRTGSQR